MKTVSRFFAVFALVSFACSTPKDAKSALGAPKASGEIVVGRPDSWCSNTGAVCYQQSGAWIVVLPYGSAVPPSIGGGASKKSPRPHDLCVKAVCHERDGIWIVVLPDPGKIDIQPEQKPAEPKKESMATITYEPASQPVAHPPYTTYEEGKELAKSIDTTSQYAKSLDPSVGVTKPLVTPPPLPEPYGKAPIAPQYGFEKLEVAYNIPTCPSGWLSFKWENYRKGDEIEIDELTVRFSAAGTSQKRTYVLSDWIPSSVKGEQAFLYTCLPSDAKVSGYAVVHAGGKVASSDRRPFSFYTSPKTSFQFNPDR